MAVNEIKSSSTPKLDLAVTLDRLHKNGPNSPEVLERLSYFKEFHAEIFKELEESIISALGIFYKVKSPKNLYSFLMSGFGYQHESQYGSFLTPVQASIRRAIEIHLYTSISAPTSAGKSYSIRDLIVEETGDAVIVVPSRALIAEYMGEIKRRFDGNKNVMISAFVDFVFTSRNLRRIFVLTPERSKDIYKIKNKINVTTFFFDEAQISEEKSRGIIFDVMVRRVKKHFPDAKIIFAHPFVKNPEAQLSKHGIDKEASYSKSYTQGSVGKICVFKHSNGKWYYFSPYIEGGHLKKNCVEFSGSFKDFALNGTHSILVYVSKASIYKGKFAEEFSDYIASLPMITNHFAQGIIENIEHILGSNNTDHKSKMIELLKKGVVIHHGSIPLEVRFLIEDFIRAGHAKLCFATSTLAQGINMPFDIVWLENNRFSGDEDERALAFKNLIGRSGRLSNEEKYDYGYVYTSEPKLFSVRINSTFELSHKSIIDTYASGSETDEDRNELIESIKDNTFDDENNMPLTKIQRLSQEHVFTYASNFLDILYREDEGIRASIGGEENKNARDLAKKYLRLIYENSLDRPLFDGEAAVFQNAISIFFHMAQGRSFKEIVGIRHSYISDRDNPTRRYAKFSQPADKLPESKLKNTFSLYPKGTPAASVSYDVVIYDTYDYLDQVISFSLSDVFIAAFKIFSDHQGDERAQKVIELFRYGTNNQVQILLMRYGIPSELVAEVTNYVQSIDDTGIAFKNTVQNAPTAIRKLLEWYLP